MAGRFYLLALLFVLHSVPVESLHGAAPLFVFRDVGKEAGIIPAATPIMGHGVGWGDADGDGWADLYIATFHYKGTKPNLFFRNRKGKFELDEQPELRQSMRAAGVLFADLDNDGDLDLYLSSMPSAADSRLAARMGHAFAGCSLFFCAHFRAATVRKWYVFASLRARLGQRFHFHLPQSHGRVVACGGQPFSVGGHLDVGHDGGVAR